MIMAQIAIPISGIIILLFMLPLLFGSIFSADLGIRNVFVKETGIAMDTILPGKPSIPTMVNFILIVISGIFALAETRLTRFFPYVGYSITIIGLISITGYLINQPALYYYIPNVSAGMAIHTSVLFIMVGIALLLLKEGTKPHSLNSVKIQTKLVFLFLSASLIPLLFVLGLIINHPRDFLGSEDLLMAVIVICITSFMTVSLFSIFISRTISKPIKDLHDIAQKISDGDVSVNADDRTNDEIGQLGKILNQMVGNVIKSGRISAIGELSGRIAHDLRNPLSVMKMSVDSIRLQPPETTIKDSVIANRLELIEKNIDRISHQVNQVLEFVRDSPLDLALVSIKTTVRRSIGKVDWPQNVKVIVSGSDVNVTCDVLKMDVVFINLIVNSIQAMDNGGTLEIKITSVDDDVVIDFVDSGPGIPEKSIEKIFEPLFTTKQHGTGLGLASCKTIIEQHGGKIFAKNNPTTFTIYLPVKQ
jgi:signal transduction histidine kinase